MGEFLNLVPFALWAGLFELSALQAGRPEDDSSPVGLGCLNLWLRLEKLTFITDSCL